MHVAIVGAGFSGTLLALRLLECGPPALRLTLLEQRATAGRGVAYSTPAAYHLLNVRAGQMSCRVDDPDHFCRWLQAHDPECAGAALPSLRPAFIGRAVYGRYLQAQLEAARAEHGARLQLRCSVEVAALLPAADGPEVKDRSAGWRLLAADGSVVCLAQHVVLALGHLPATAIPPPRWAAAATGHYHHDPQRPGLAAQLRGAGPILLWGLGLTMVDTYLALRAAGHSAPVLAIARRGQAPQAHRDGLSPRPWQPPPAADGPLSLTALVRQVRADAAATAAAGGDWRQVIDGLRPHTPGLWQGLGAQAQARFLRHVRPFWDSHRHRLAPAVAQQLQAAQARGMLRLSAARLMAVTPSSEGLSVRLRARRGGEESLACAAIVNCTGSVYDYRRAATPLLQQLLDRGLVQPHVLAPTLALGLHADAQGAVLQRDGRRSTTLHLLGPSRLGSCLESVAVPELRQQAWALAGTLLQPEARAD